MSGIKDEIYSYLQDYPPSMELLKCLEETGDLYLIGGVLREYKDYGKIKNYLYVIAGNLIRNYYKKPKEVCIEDGGNREETVPDHAGDILDRLMVMDALSALDQTEKDIVILRYYQDQRIRDISRILGIPASTARYKLKNAEKKLKSTLEL